MKKSFQREPSCSMWTDGQTGMTKLIVAFLNFANKPKKYCILQLLKSEKSESVRCMGARISMKQTQLPKKGDTSKILYRTK